MVKNKVETLPDKQLYVVAHGGAGSKNEHSDGAHAAARGGLVRLREGESALESVCFAITVLEDDNRFNAGVGSKKRSDGSVQMDAACMDAQGRFGAVAALEGFRNPIRIAQAVMESPHTLLAGPGAAQFASQRKFTPWVPGEESSCEDPVSDTVGCVVYDGETFVAGLSTGGTGDSIPGRVGDVPIFGSGLYAGSDGAVAATGNGEIITLHLTAYRVYQMLERGTDPQIALKTGLSWFESNVDIGLILVSRKGYAGGSNRTMAWAGECIT